MAGIPPSNPSLDRFRQVGETEQVSLQDGGNDLDRQQKTGNLGERLVRWIDGKDANNRATRAFFDALEQAYGKRAKDWAIEGYEGRVDDGKPLSGYRIQQILQRAESARLLDKNALPQLLDEQTPMLVDQALRRAGVTFPDGVGDKWRTFLIDKIKQDIRQTDKFKDPSLLETHSFAREFGGFINGRINGHYMDALRQIGTFEQKCQEVKNDPETHGNWGMMHPDQLDRYVFTDRSRQNFLSGFGQGENKIGNFDTYWNQKVIEPGAKAIEDMYGPRREFERYDDIFWDGQSRDYKDGINSIYRSIPQQDTKGFAEFTRLDSGLNRARALNGIREEKFHISVQPKDIGRAYQVLAPLLLEKDCPITYWKVGNIDAFGQVAGEVRDKLDAFEAGEEVVYDGELLKGKYGGRSIRKEDLSQEEQETFVRELNARMQDLQRAIEGCQFTLYPMKGEDSSKFIDLLDKIEQTLRGAGLAPPPTPESDEGVTSFVSFRIGWQPGEDGRPQRIDPFHEDYPQFKQTFSSNPFYLGQGFNLVSTEINQLLDSLAAGVNVGTEIGALQEKIDSMELSDEHRAKLNQRLNEVRDRT